MTKLSVDLVVTLAALVVAYQLDGGQAQQESGGGLRFPNLFAGLGGGNNPFSLSNLFRQARPQQQQQPAPPVGFVPGVANLPIQQQPQQPPPFPSAQQLSPVVAQQPGPNPFLQAPPLAFQPTAFPPFVQNPGPPPVQQQPQAVAPPGFGQPQGQFQPSQPVPVQAVVQQQQQPQQPWPFSNNNNNPLVPALVPIGNLPIASQPQQQQQATAPTQQPTIIPSPPGPPPPPSPVPTIVPSQPLPLSAAPAVQQAPQQPLLLPAQFALSANSLSQQKHLARTGKSFALPKGDLTPAASTNVIDCGSGNDLGFCASSEKYPRHVVDDMMHRCHETVRQMYAEIPEDYEGLGDSHQPAGVSHENASSSGKNPSLPWSWSDYRKESACDSELRFIQPHVAQDRTGRWRIIVQTDEFPQRVAIDVCRRVNDVCKVFTDCGRKSRCVQRYSYQPLISLDQDAKAAGQCPTMAVFRFPTSCVCHVEVEKPVAIKSERRALTVNGVRVRA